MNRSWDFPGGPVVKNLPSSAGNMGSIPGWGTRIPHAMGQLSQHTTTTEFLRSGAPMPRLERTRNTAREDPTCCN